MDARWLPSADKMAASTEICLKLLQELTKWNGNGWNLSRMVTYVRWMKLEGSGRHFQP